MAKQSGTVFFEGTIDDLTFYKMNGQYYVRKKSSLTKKRFKKDPQFENSRRNAAYFGKGAKLASKAYQMLSPESRRHGLFGDMTAVALRLVRAGKSEAEVIAGLQLLWPPAALATSPTKGALSLSRWTVTSAGKLHIYNGGTFCFPASMAMDSGSRIVPEGYGKLYLGSEHK